MAKGYIVSIHTKIIDEEKLKLYGVHAKSALEANAGSYVARGSNISKLEGIPPERCTILEFESVEAAKAFYACEACLLYTSPSPRDVEESRMPSSA